MATLTATVTMAQAFYADSLSINNQLVMGEVDVVLKQYEKGEDGEILMPQEDRIVLPGEEVSQIPRITNKSEPCFVRVFLSFGEEETRLAETDLLGMSEEWRKIGEYYYLIEPLQTNQCVDVFQGVKVPESWTEECSNENLMVGIQVDAIQAQNFRPNYEDKMPWGNEEIKVCVHNPAMDRVIYPYMDHAVIYEGGAHKLITVSEDFFSNLGLAMPGDILEDEILIQNNSEHDIEVFFRTESLELSEAQSKLLNQLGLRITLEDDVLYEGGLSAEAIGNNLSLRTYQPGQILTFRFQITVPKEIENESANIDTLVRWIFSVKEDAVEKRQIKSVKTGDNTMAGLMEFLILLSGAFIFICLKLRRRWLRDAKG